MISLLEKCLNCQLDNNLSKQIQEFIKISKPTGLFISPYETLKFLNLLVNIKIYKDSNTQNTSKKQHLQFIKILEENNCKEYRNTFNNDGIFYVNQPNGTQQYPDFHIILIKNNLKYILNIELKSGNKKIMWNDGMPRHNTFYLYTDNKSNNSLFISGNNEYFFKHMRCIVDVNKDMAIFKEYIKKKYNNNIVNIYPRKSVSQKINIDNITCLDKVNIYKHNIIMMNKIIFNNYK